MGEKGGVIVSKREQVNASNKSMFIWVAAASAVLGFAIVISVFLVQMLMFNEKVLQEKGKTAATLKDNLTNIDKLKSNIRALDTNQSLTGLKTRSEDQAIQVILDALPSDVNELALGASLQSKLLNGYALESLKVDTVVTGSDSVVVSEDSSGTGEISFSFIINESGDNGETEFKQILNNLEKSIRVIDVTGLTLENGKMTVQAKAYYEPAKEIKLKDKTVK